VRIQRNEARSEGGTLCRGQWRSTKLVRCCARLSDSGIAPIANVPFCSALALSSNLAQGESKQKKEAEKAVEAQRATEREREDSESAESSHSVRVDWPTSDIRTRESQFRLAPIDPIVPL
jgi:hypothetical protein